VTRLALVIALAALAGCQGDGHVNIFGYTSRPPFDPDIHTVYVPVFKNTAVLETSPYRGLPEEITKAVVRELGSRPGAPRVVTDCEYADTILIGQLTSIQKRMLNQNQQGLLREGEVTFVCTLVWQDLRSGKVLSNRRPPREGLPPAPPFDPTLPPPPEPPVKEEPRAVTVVASGRILPELGETNATAEQMAVNDLAKKIVNMMEKPW
jgi:hypothetical protein